MPLNIIRVKEDINWVGFVKESPLWFNEAICQLPKWIRMSALNVYIWIVLCIVTGIQTSVNCDKNIVK